MQSTEEMFQKEAKNYDKIIMKIIPFYDEILQTLIDVIPFPIDRKISVMDLGCGTGTLALKLKQNYPNASITCIDVAEDMINIAKEKLKTFSNVKFQVADLHDYEFNQNFDVIISSLALHHLHGDDQKKKFFQKIFTHLNPRGYFVNADVSIAPNDALEEIYVSKWIDFMKNNELDFMVYKKLDVEELRDAIRKVLEEKKQQGESTTSLQPNFSGFPVLLSRLNDLQAH